MKQYQLTANGSYQIGNMSIPPNPNNTDYIRMQAEVAANEAEILPVPAPTVSELSGAAKIECRRRILALYADWKQTNMVARAAELTDKKIYGGTLLAQEETERLALQGIWAWIKAMRAKSDVLEASIQTMTEEQRRNLNVMADMHWT